MTDTTEQVVDTTAPDANVSPPEDVADAAELKEGNEAESSPAVTDSDEQSERKKGVAKRIDELTRNWREAERREAALLEMLQRQQPQKPAEVVEDKPKAQPKLEDFNYDEAAYQAALYQHVKDEAARAAREELRMERQREQERARKETFKQRSAEFAKANPDYDTLTRDPSLPITQDVADLIVESDKGPDVLYYLAQNREIAARLAQLPAVAAAREIGRIEAKLEKPPVKPAPAVSKAPPPPPKIEANESAPSPKTTDPSGDVLSDEEWVRAERKRLSRKKG